MKEVSITVRDGTRIGAAIYAPEGGGKYPALLIPDRALGSDQAMRFVYVVNAEKKVEFRPVKIGPMIDGLRIVKGGLKPGEQIIVEGLLRVRPGVLVDAKPWEAPAQTAGVK